MRKRSHERMCVNGGMRDTRLHAGASTIGALIGAEAPTMEAMHLAVAATRLTDGHSLRGGHLENFRLIRKLLK